MPSETSLGIRAGILRPLAASLFVTAGCNAWADDPNPYYIGVSGGYSHDSNIFRAPSNAVGDNYWSAGLVGGIDQPFGRQHFTASGNVRTNRFQQQTQLNNTSYGLNAALDWSTIQRLSGTVSIATSESLANYSTVSTLITEKNVERSNQFIARAQWGMVSLLSLEGSYTHQALSYSAVAYDTYNVNQDAVSIGLTYRPSGLLSLGSAVRFTRGTFPQRVAGGQDFRRTDLDLTAVWSATGRSTINGRLSVGRQTNSGLSQYDFSGVTGFVTWVYSPTGKLVFKTTLTRDTGVEGSFFSDPASGPNGTTRGDNSRLSTSLAFSANYAVTAKINVNGALRYNHRSLVFAFADPNLATESSNGKDNVRSISLGATYAPTRSVLLSCNVGRDSRGVSAGTPVFLSYPYAANTANCSAQFTIQ